MEKLECKLARNYCFQHSVRTACTGLAACEETVFDGTADGLIGEVLAVIRGNRTGEIPEYPQGLVLHSGDKSGAFDRGAVQTDD